MKFKYMLRGLGLGVIITAAVMSAYNRNAVADARVAVLKEYGLGEESRLVEETGTPEETTEEASAEETTEQVIVRDEEIEAEISSVLDAAKEAEQAGTGESSPESAEGQPQEPSADGGASAAEDTVRIDILSGDDSGTVSRKLYNAGLIENASEYDAFLMQHGYDKKLSTGTKTLGVGDSWQEIAEKITRK